MVQEVKKTSKRMNGDWNTRISRFLLSQYSTPCTVTRYSPAELMMNRKLETALSQLMPNESQIFKKEEVMASKKQLRSFEVGEEVLAKKSQTARMG